MKQIYLYKSLDDFKKGENAIVKNIEEDTLLTDLGDDANTLTGYDLEGWYNGDKDRVAKVFIDTVTDDKSSKFYAKWKPATNTKYKALYISYSEDNALYDYGKQFNHAAILNNNYILEEVDLVGTTGKKVNVAQKEFEGFDIVSDENGDPIPQYLSQIGDIVEDSDNKILPDGSTVVVYYYKRKTVRLYFAPTLSEKDYAVTFYDHKGLIRQSIFIDESKSYIEGLYGEKITDIKITKADNTVKVNPVFVNNNYTFTSHDETYDLIFTPIAIQYYFHFFIDHEGPINDKVDALIASKGDTSCFLKDGEAVDGYVGTATEDTNASIQIYFSNTDATVIKFISEHKDSFTDCTYTNSEYRDIYYTNENSERVRLRTYFVYYIKNSSTITFNYNGGVSADKSLIKFEGKVGTSLTDEQLSNIPNPERPYYNFIGWVDGTNTNVDLQDSAIKFIAGGREYYAKWELVDYTIKFNEYRLNSYFAETNVVLNIETLQIVVPKLANLIDHYSFEYWTKEADTTKAIIRTTDSPVSFAKENDIWNGTKIKEIIDTVFTDTNEVNLYPVFRPLTFKVEIHAKNEVKYYDVDKNSGNDQQLVTLKNRDDIISGKLQSRLDVMEQYINNINKFLCQTNKESYQGDYTNARHSGIEGYDDYVLPEVWSDGLQDPTKIQLYKKVTTGLNISFVECTAEEQSALTVDNWKFYQYYLNIAETSTEQYDNILGFIYNNRNQLLKSKVIDCLPNELTLAGSSIAVKGITSTPVANDESEQG